MLIYLMRHGIATPRGESSIDDASRALTPEGLEKVRRIGQALRRLKAEIDEIWTSPLLRAHQTAEITASAFALAHAMRIVRELEPSGDTQALIDQLRKTPGLRGVLLVGHEPDMGALARKLICGRQVEGPPGRSASIRFKKGGVACIAMDEKGATRAR